MKILTSNFTIPGTQNLTINGFEGDTNLSNVFSNISNLKFENISFKNTAKINNLFINSWPKEEYDSETGEYKREFDFSNVKFSDYLEIMNYSSLFYGYNTASFRTLNISNLNIKANGSGIYFLNVSAGWSGENYTDAYIKNCNIIGFSYFPQNIYIENSAIELNYNEISVYNAPNVKFINACNIKTERKTDLQSYNISFENIKSFRTNGPIDANYIKNLDFSNMISVSLVNSQDTFELGDISNTYSREFSNLNIKNISFGNTIINSYSTGTKYGSGFLSGVSLDNVQMVIGQSYQYSPTFGGVINAYNVNLDVRNSYGLQNSSSLKEISFTNFKASVLGGLFSNSNNLSNNAVKNIVNAIITFDNQINTLSKNMANTNAYSPFYQTKFNNSYYTEYHETLTALGWTF